MKVFLVVLSLVTVMAAFAQNSTKSGAGSYFCEPGDYSDECQHL